MWIACSRGNARHACENHFVLKRVRAIQEGQVYVPDFANHMGMNDRFALLHPKSGGVWKERLNHALRHCVEEPIHSESFARQFASENHLEVRIQFELQYESEFVMFSFDTHFSLDAPREYMYVCPTTTQTMLRPDACCSIEYFWPPGATFFFLGKELFMRALLPIIIRMQGVLPISM